MKRPEPYIYFDGGYEFLSIHRKAEVYDPRNTDNLIILDYFNTIRKVRDTSTIYYSLMEKHLEDYKNPILPTLPVSYQSVYDEINMSWVDIIHQMIFIDKAFDTFNGEYGRVIKNIIEYDSLDRKETLVYRYHHTGESAFHVAAKIWLFNEYYAAKRDILGFDAYNVDDDLKHVLYCYQELGKRIDKNDSCCIIYMTDFNNITLMDYIQEFVKDLKENKVI